MKKNLKPVLIGILMALLTTVFTVIVGRTYTADIDLKPNIHDVKQDDLEIVTDPEGIVSIDSYELKDNGHLYVHMTSKNRGRTFVDIRANGESVGLVPVYVMALGVIHYNNALGPSTGDTMIPIMSSAGNTPLPETEKEDDLQLRECPCSRSDHLSVHFDPECCHEHGRLSGTDLDDRFRREFG